MRVYLEWLKELVDLSAYTTEEIVSKLSLYAIEVEGVMRFINATDIVVGHVKTCEKHPDSDHLSLLSVDIGTEVLQIICGAPNIAKDQYVIVAKEGAVLSDNFKIKRSKIRGIESCGMVCSLQELGIEKKYIDEKYVSGIYYFEEAKPLGMNGAKALLMEGDIIELGVTPNRGDLLSMLGVAYECSAVFNVPLKPLAYEVMKPLNTQPIDVTIDTPACATYYGQVIRGVTIKQSPAWLISRLIAFGVRPINNCVDITNYIMALFGQPLHAFDYHRLGSQIKVRNAKQDETIITLDGIKRRLETQDLVIADGQKPVAIAGVMGGLDTEVTPQTTNIVLEAAVFDPMSVRKTSTRLGLRSESSMRFERGVDLNTTIHALEYACYLFASLAEGTIDSRAIAGLIVHPSTAITLTEADVKTVLGIPISQKDIHHIAQSLHFTVKNGVVEIPNRRRDITIKEDLIEEVGRLYGYDHLKTSFPKDDHVGHLSLRQMRIRQMKDILAHMGLLETVTYSLVSKQQTEQFCFYNSNAQPPISLLMPLSEAHQYLRCSLLPSLLEVASYNIARKTKQLALYEISQIYTQQDTSTAQKLLLSGVLSGLYTHTLWNGKQEMVDFYLVKGIIQRLFDSLGVQLIIRPLATNMPELHPHRSAEIILDQKTIGYIGQLHPKFALENALDDVYVFEIAIDSLLDPQLLTPKFTPIAKFPSVERDIALVVKKSVLASDLIQSIRKIETTLSDAMIFDVYQGEKVGEDEKSIAIKLVFTAHEALTDDVIQNKIKRILKDLNYRYQANLRA